ncbi:MAG: DUF1080 domain-containing protein [Armatimonadetes bacterium]|nr:DUF1080 domain-containing protein [Armatimonadota bacterium]
MLNLLISPILLLSAYQPSPDPGAPDQAGPKPNTLTAEEKREGFRLLFDGKTLNGWRGWKREAPPKDWSVKDGTMALTLGDDSGDIMTSGTFADFELRLEWKISPRGNSGIFFRVSEEFLRPWETGPEMQILDDEGYPDGNPKTSAGSDYAMHAPSKTVLRPAGEWNQVRIIANGNHVEYWLNGKKVVEYTIGSEDWNARYRASKYKDMPNFAKRKSGYIVLQDHRDVVAFRSIRIRNL